MTMVSASGGLIFNLTTNGNGQFLAERMKGVVEDPATLGTLLALVYAVSSVAQVVVGRLIDRFRLKPLQLAIVLAQVPLLALAAFAQGWWVFVALVATMVFVFGNIPFTDATIVRFVDDRMRSRVAGLRLAISLTFSSAAVWALGPVVKAQGFATLFLFMAAVALFTAAVVLMLPDERHQG
jgi:predicted MFS family arabinose efflux permease